jgi:hypothetical protein
VCTLKCEQNGRCSSARSSHYTVVNHETHSERRLKDFFSFLDTYFCVSRGLFKPEVTGLIAIVTYPIYIYLSK